MKILVIDAYNMIHRARFGYANGEHAIVFNFFRSLKSEIARHEPDRVYIVSEGTPKHRLLLNNEYKGQRKPVTDPGFYRQKNEIFSLCKYFPFTFIRHPEYECDDVIGHLCTKTHAGDEVTIISSDSDFIQLLDDESTKLWNPVKKKFVDQWPVDYVTWKALKGDPTDNVPGIKGIGEKRAFALCETSSTLDEFLIADESRKLLFDSAYAQIKLADINEKCPKWEVADHHFKENFLKEAFTEFGFKSIIGKSWTKWKEIMEVLDGNFTRQQTEFNQSAAS